MVQGLTRQKRCEEHQRLISSFVRHYESLSQARFPQLTWPDRTERNRNECDCVAKSGSSAKSLAIELTEVDSYSGLKETEKLYLRYFQGREKELKPKDYFAQIIIPFEHLQKGKIPDWQSVSDSMKSFVDDRLSTLAEGWYLIDDATGVPFQFGVDKKKCNPANVFFSVANSRQFVDDCLKDSFLKALNGNRQKFSAYGDSEYIKILLIESQDFQLMNEGRLKQGYQRAIQECGSGGYDEVWLCWTIPLETGLPYQFFRLEPT